LRIVQFLSSIDPASPTGLRSMLEAESKPGMRATEELRKKQASALYLR
jgi:hypothetical protein